MKECMKYLKNPCYADAFGLFLLAVRYTLSLDPQAKNIIFLNLTRENLWSLTFIALCLYRMVLAIYLKNKK